MTFDELVKQMLLAAIERTRSVIESDQAYLRALEADLRALEESSPENS